MKNVFSLLLILLIVSCGLYRKTDLREVPVNVDDRAKKNIEEGRSFRFGDAMKGRGGTFEFASSNEMWRASISLLDFAPFSNVDYSGGIIITDWFADESVKNEYLKITVRFLSNEIRADALKIKVFSKECEKTINCKISQSNPKIENELKVAILKRAAKYKKDIIDSNPKRDLNSILAPGDKN